MSDNFQETINLRQQMEKAKNKQKQQLMGKRKTAGIDQVYDEGEDRNETKKNLQKINRPPAPPQKKGIGSRIMFFIIIILACVSVYFYLDAKNARVEKEKKERDRNTWYMVELSDKNTYYGQIEDITADPVIMRNVYYNYDQVKNDENPAEIGKLRLVKRGDETQGGDGTLNVVRAQILFMEPLKEGSKVLEAIRNNEK